LKNSSYVYIKHLFKTVTIRICVLREAVLAREREEDAKWRNMMMQKFAEDDRLGSST
jgi:hypothetical protein